MTDRPDRDVRLRFVTAGMEFFFAVALPTIGGLLLDLRLGSLPLWTLLGFGLGFAAGLYRLIREVPRSPAEHDDADERQDHWQESTMREPRPLDISLASLVKWVLPWMLGVTAFGVLPTWLMVGWPGIWAQLAAVAVVLSVMMGIGILTVRAAHAGPERAATVFLGSSIARLVVCPVLLSLIWLVTRLSLETMAVWMVIAYLGTLGLEVVWLIKALRHAVDVQDAERKAAKHAGADGESPPAPTHDFSI
jgi:hypothetical protein